MSKRKNKDKASSVSRAERLLQIKDADAKVYEIMQEEIPALTSTEKAEVMEALRKVRDCFKPYLNELAGILETCRREGHVGKWEEETFYEDTVIDHQRVHNMPYTKWGRVCTRCGQTEWSDSMPKEVINEEHRNQVKELRQQIRDIESEIEE